MDHEVALRSVLADLPAGQEAALLHLLECRVCQDLAVSRLRREVGGEVPDLSPVLRRLSESLPVALDAAGGRFAQAEAWLDELLAVPPERRREALAEPRFQTKDLLELLLDRIQAVQIREPRSAEAWAGLAWQLAGRLRDCDTEDGEALLQQARAADLAGNARRLLGRWREAEEAFRDGARCLASVWGASWETASHCRLLGLLRWEEGCLDEAEALLRQGGRVFGELAVPAEEAATRALLGLLSLERNQHGRAVRLLQASWSTLDPEARPWLTLRTGLSLALALAELRQVERARRLFDEAQQHDACVTDERESARRHWLEGKLQSLLGRNDDAERLLVAARRQLISEASLPEAALCTLDLAALLAQANRAAEVPRLLADLEAAFPSDPGLELARSLICPVAAAAVRTVQDAALYCIEAAADLRRAFRESGRAVDRLPFG